MDYKRLAKPRFILAVLGLIIISALIFSETIESEVGIPIIVAILAAFGVYEGYKSKSK